jgi:hypothetical protein
MSEQTFYQDQHGVTVTNTRFVVGPQMYPIRGITSVSSSDKTHPPQRGFEVILAMLGLLLALFGLAGKSLGIVAVGIVMFAGAKWSAARKKWRHEHSVLIQTGGMQQAALVTEDKERRDKILAALHSATASS